MGKIGFARVWPYVAGDMARRIRSHDWAATPLGPIETWPQSLRTAVDLMLGSPGPAFIGVGPDLILLYNDAYGQLLGQPCRDALGQAYAQLWADCWAEEGPLIEAVMRGEPQEREVVLADREQRLGLPPGWYSISWTPLRNEAGDIAGCFCQILATAGQRLRTLMEGIPQLVWRAVDGGHWTWSSPQWTEYTGFPAVESVELGWLRAIHPEDRLRAARFWQETVRSGYLEMEARIFNAGEGGYRWCQTRVTPVRNESGAIVEWLGTSTDIHDLRELQEKQDILVAELQHRVRNMLTVVRSVFARTALVGRELEDVADHFTGRLDALARTQVILARNASATVDLETLLRDELLTVGAGDGPNLRIDGPEIALPSGAAESVGLAIHELTTNAIKYGALKVAGATLDISWFANMDYGGENRLTLTWAEQGVPAIPIEPARRGFGLELIEEALPYRLGAETSLEFRAGGVRCSISLPLPKAC